MLDKGGLKEFERETLLPGKWFKCQNGDEACLASMPIGPSGRPFMEFINKITQEEIEIKINEEDTIKLKGPEYLFHPVGFDDLCGILVKIMKINYPNISLDDVDGLFVMSQLEDILGWFFGMDMSRKQPAKIEGDNSDPSKLSKDKSEEAVEEASPESLAESFGG